MTSLEMGYKTAQDEVFVFPASFAQQRLWFLHQLAPQNPFYNVAAAVRLQGTLNVAALEQTFNEIARRHESLRTNFSVIEEQLAQVITPHCNLAIPIIDLQSVPVDKQAIAATQHINQAAQCSFDLTHDPLLQIQLLKLNETEHILVLVLHHIIADGWSMGVLLRELGALYTAFCAGRPSPLADPAIQYADFACWQREWLQGEVLASQLSYWQQQLQNLPVLELPTNHPRPPVPTYRGTTQFVQFSQRLTDDLDTLSQQEGVSLFMTVLAAFQALLYRYTGQTDIVIGSPIANRNRSELEDVIGFFINSLVLRTDLSGNPTFRQLLSRVRDVALGAYAHQDIPFEKLVQVLQPQRDLSRHPLFQVAIALQNTPIDALELPNLRLEPFDVDSGTTRLDLEFHLWPSPNGLQGKITYSTDLFEPDAIARLLGHFQTLLEGIVAHPNQRIAELPLLTEAERQQLLIEWNPTPQPALQPQNALCFHYQFEIQAQQTPDAIAVVSENKHITYQELNRRSNQLAHYLQHLGVGPETLVGVCIGRSLDMIIAVLGILKAGAAYLPLDPSYPPERLQFMLEDSQVSLLVTQRHSLPTFAQIPLKLVCLDRDFSTIRQHSQNNPKRNVTASNLAYVIYTSGSTGQPKGVLIEHRGLVNLAHAQREIFHLQPRDRVLQFASLSFDASIFEIVMVFQSGATLYLAPKGEFGPAFATFLQTHAITTVTLPPSVLRVLPVENLPALHTVISAGEACSSDVVARWLKGDCRFFNAYGPTEATVWSTIAQIHNPDTKPLMGRAIANTQLYVLDPHLNPVPIGISGELYIAGPGLARGYLNHPELTTQKFITPTPHPSLLTSHPSPLTPPSSPLYKTGDLVRYHPDGNLEFLGRIDHQVKIRGYRVELGEIEATLSQHPTIQEVVVNASENAFGHKQLIAYVVWKPQQFSTPQDLHHFLQTKLPEYLIPSAFVVLRSLPLTPNGKVDRRALQAITPEESSPLFFTAPRTSTEATLTRIWQQLLHLEQVSVDSNFFELGGDSLLAMRLMHEIQQQFQQELPLATLFQAPTIAQLAAFLEAPIATSQTQSKNSEWSPLVPIQASGSKLPFFCVHPILGTILPYCELAHQLGPDQPFYGLQPIGLNGDQPPYTCIKDMAAHYIKAIQTVQPQGPYVLGGWSFGGLVAFEMAQQLHRAGHAIALLAILDTLAPTADNQPSAWDGLKFLLTTAISSGIPFLLDYISLMLGSRLGNTRSDRPLKTSRFKLLHRIRHWQQQRQQSAIANLLSEASQQRMLDELILLPMLRVFYANSQASDRYQASAYPHKITLFRTAKPLGKVEKDTTLGWSQLTPHPVEVHNISGNHLMMLKKPHVQDLAEQLQRCMQQV